jgi:CRP-like cAMP-binding protein
MAPKLLIWSAEVGICPSRLFQTAVLEITMKVATLSAPQVRPLEDPLAHLPCSTIHVYPKGQTIYGPDESATSLYLIIEGSVKICRSSALARQVVVDVYQPDEFFGESALLGMLQRTESAVALEDTKVMTWTTQEIEELAMQRPKLGIALLQLLVQRSMEFGSRIESLSVDNIARRLARALVRFSERLGHEDPDGSVQMSPLTHEFLSQYVGTSREIVTHFMNQFRRQGYLRYSRKGILLHRDALRGWLLAEEMAA